jgi:hypothetical protein
VGLEVAHELGHRLLGHLRPVGQGADRGAGVVQVLEHRAVRRPHLGVAPLGEPGQDDAVERHEGLAHQHREREGAGGNSR